MLYYLIVYISLFFLDFIYTRIFYHVNLFVLHSCFEKTLLTYLLKYVNCTIFFRNSDRFYSGARTHSIKMLQIYILNYIYVLPLILFLRDCFFLLDFLSAFLVLIFLLSFFFRDLLFPIFTLFT